MKIDKLIEKISKEKTKLTSQKLSEIVNQIYPKRIRSNSLSKIRVKIKKGNKENLLNFLKILRLVVQQCKKSNDDEQAMIINQISYGCWEIILSVTSLILSILNLLFEFKKYKDDKQDKKETRKIYEDIKNEIDDLKSCFKSDGDVQIDYDDSKEKTR